MCGRFALRPSKTSWFARFRQPYPRTNRPMFNIAPKAIVPIVRKETTEDMQWGLIPKWSHDQDIGYKMINARAETLNEKPAYKSLVARNRCLVPVSGFYEWQKEAKQPYYIRMKEQDIFALAGLYSEWVSPEGAVIATFTIITTEPNKTLAPIHPRMPVIVKKDNDEVWLDENITSYNDISKLLVPFDSEAMEVYPVSKLVNSPKNDSEELINEITSDYKLI